MAFPAGLIHSAIRPQRIAIFAPRRGYTARAEHSAASAVTVPATDMPRRLAANRRQHGMFRRRRKLRRHKTVGQNAPMLAAQHDQDRASQAREPPLANCVPLSAEAPVICGTPTAKHWSARREAEEGERGTIRLRMVSPTIACDFDHRGSSGRHCLA
jgi:hypothetical protein